MVKAVDQKSLAHISNGIKELCRQAQESTKAGPLFEYKPSFYILHDYYQSTTIRYSYDWYIRPLRNSGSWIQIEYYVWWYY